ncbi:MAG: cytochrome P450 [Sphingomonadales bacterium]
MSSPWQPPHFFPRYRRWLVTRYADVSDLLRRSELEVANVGRGTRGLGERSGFDMTGLVDTLDHMPLFLNPPLHSPERRIFARTLGLVSSQDIERIVHRHLGRIRDRALADGGLDGVSDLADVIAMGVFTDLLGLPESDIAMLCELTAGVLGVTNRDATLSLYRKLSARADQCIDYLVEAVRRRRADPGEDAISRMLSVAGEEDERHTAARLYGLLAAATETSATFLSHSILRLIEHPEERAMLAANPDKLDRGVEELLRLTTPARYSLRHGLEDVIIGDIVIPAEVPIMLDLYLANRDPAAFRNPEIIDLDNKVPILTFSEGLHGCVGARFARIEGRLMLEELLALPSLGQSGPIVEGEVVDLLPRLKSIPLAFA